jgi:hypothetical protein
MPRPAAQTERGLKPSRNRSHTHDTADGPRYDEHQERNRRYGLIPDQHSVKRTRSAFTKRRRLKIE